MIEQYQAESAEEFEQQGDEGAEGAPETGFAEQQQEEQQPRSLEDIASKMGWTPRDAWRGDPDKWRPADEFVERTAEINSRLANELRAVKDTVSNINRVNQAVMERELEKQRQQLLAEKREAIEYGDVARVDHVDQQLQQLPNVTQQATIPPETQSFVEKHASWWQRDQEATAWAINRAGQLGQQGITSPARQLAIVERELAQMFPELVVPEKPKPKPAPLMQPGNRGGSGRAKTFNDLPKEAQEAAIYFEKKGVSREDYIKSYFDGQEQ